MADEISGPLVTGSEVETAARETLQLWMPDYLAWLERKYNRAVGSLIPPRSWVSSGDTDRWPEEQLPTVMLLSTGISEEPDRDGADFYRAKFALGLAVIVSARDTAGTDELSKLYTAACRAILVHHPSLGGLADAVEWVDERYDNLPSRNRRQLAAGQVIFRVAVSRVAQAKVGPDAPGELGEESVVDETEVILDPRADLSDYQPLPDDD